MHTRAKQKSVAEATALGARVPRAELFFLSQETGFPVIEKVSLQQFSWLNGL